MIGAPIGFAIGAPFGATGRTASLSVTLDDATLAATGVLALTGQVGIVLEDAVLIATAALAIVGQEGTVLDDCVLYATATFRRDNITGARQTAKIITSQMTKYQTITTAQLNNRQITA